MKNYKFSLLSYKAGSLKKHATFLTQMRMWQRKPEDWKKKKKGPLGILGLKIASSTISEQVIKDATKILWKCWC